MCSYSVLALDRARPGIRLTGPEAEPGQVKVFLTPCSLPFMVVGSVGSGPNAGTFWKIPYFGIFRGHITKWRRRLDWV